MAKEYLSAKPPYVVVEKGDTLSRIAEKYGSHIAGSGIYGTGGKLETLVKLNDITDANFIVVGQKIQLSGTSTAKKNTSNTPVIKAFGLQSNSNTVYATWTWSKSNTENYRVIWQYDSGNGVWFDGSDSTTTSKQSTYGIPSNAKKVRFKVRPISKKRKVNGKETSYWTASWSNIKTYDVKNNPPVTPELSDSNFTIDTKNKITITMRNLDTSVNGLNASAIQFQIYRNSTKLVHTGKANIDSLGNLTYSWQASAGYKYAIRCRSLRGGVYSDWSKLTEEKSSMPAAPSKIIDCYARIRKLTGEESEYGIYVKWSGVSSAITYTVQYVELANGTTGFDTNQDLIQTVEVNPYPANTPPPTSTEVWKLKSGATYAFRVRANGSGSDLVSGWTKTATASIGTTPAQPTAWSSASKVMVGDELTLYWIHNSEDKSSASASEIHFTITDQNGTTYYKHKVDHDGSSTSVSDATEYKQVSGIWDEQATNWISGRLTSNSSDGSSGDFETEDDSATKTFKYVVQTTNFPEGAILKWSVATRGVKDAFGSKSTEKEISILDRPTVVIDPTGDVSVSDEEDLDYIFMKLPMELNISVSANLQTVIGYHIAITATETHETIDDVGNVKTVLANSVVYSQYFDIDDNPWTLELSAGDITLENNVRYRLDVTASMDSGLGATETNAFRVFWDDAQYQPNAEIAIDSDSLMASIRPFCEDEVGVLLENVLLSVYRREFDGSFVEIIKDVPNTSATFATDPHPALDYARYRVVARDINTGSVSYYDIPGYPVNEKAVVLQWDEDWSEFSSEDFYSMQDGSWNDEAMAAERSEPIWAGSILKLPYNIDVSDNNSRDVELVKYIGRKNPVSYYGTQIGQTASWSVAIPKSDTDTLTMLRRLAIWMGDVYVREPSGSGYWASVSVSFSQNHCEVTIPVTLEITRVEGGV